MRRPFPLNRLAWWIRSFCWIIWSRLLWLPAQQKAHPITRTAVLKTVTYMLEGHFVHHDSAGNSGTIGPGDVQWMTAGQGVVHSEMPDEDLLEKWRSPAWISNLGQSSCQGKNDCTALSKTFHQVKYQSQKAKTARFG